MNLPNKFYLIETSKYLLKIDSHFHNNLFTKPIE